MRDYLLKISVIRRIVSGARSRMLRPSNLKLCRKGGAEGGDIGVLNGVHGTVRERTGKEDRDASVRNDTRSDRRTRDRELGARRKLRHGRHHAAAAAVFGEVRLPDGWRLHLPERRRQGKLRRGRRMQKRFGDG